MERTDTDRTIVDTAIITPLLEDTNYATFGHILPVIGGGSGSTYKEKMFAVTNPEFKFADKEFTNYDRFIGEGIYTVTERHLDSDSVEDAMAGTSYVKSVAKKREKDEDGMSLHIHSRYSALGMGVAPLVSQTTTLNETYYLNALSSVEKGGKTIFNASGDNKIGIVDTISQMSSSSAAFPYVAMQRDKADNYGLFRLGAYYKEHLNVQTGASTNIFNGDTHISSMTYTSSLFYDIRMRKRAGKSGILRIIAGSLLVAFAVVATVLTLGLGLPITALIASAGLSTLASGINQAIVTKVYGEEYDKGLKETLKDADTIAEFGGNPVDDEVQWHFDILRNVFFESNINMGLRVEPTIGPKFYQDSPENYNKEGILSYCMNKISTVDTDNENGRLYNGIAIAEIYKINKDYLRFNKEKIYFPLGIEYDCCSDCQEYFPNRIHWSEQSFQEELSDNYRNFLSNNYRDIEGETGGITNLFRMQNNLYIHTEECIWHLPQNVQERITGDVTSFIGTGEYFSLPPRRMADDGTGMSSGSDHKWSTIKTPYGVFFVSNAEGKIYNFNGNKLKPISSNGLFSYFKKHGRLAFLKDYEDTKGKKYRYDNNPSNPLGVGFISTYDAERERILFTKRDFLFKDSVVGDTVPEDFEVVYYQGDYLLFQDYEKLIAEHLALDSIYQGIEDGEMLFIRFDELLYKSVVTNIAPSRLVTEDEILNNSWTLSYSLKNQTWTSWHSYLPKLYFNTADKFSSWNTGGNFYTHNILGKQGTFYDVLHQFIVEYVSNSNNTQTTITDSIKLLTEATKFSTGLNEYEEIRFRTFSKMILNNSRQCSGELTLVSKNTSATPDNYLLEQVNEVALDQILLDKNEETWSMNNLRDIRTDYTTPIFNSNLPDLQTAYFIDKILNTPSMDFNKPWEQLESFRDKYLAIRLIFDNFDDVKLVLNYSIENETPSVR